MVKEIIESEKNLFCQDCGKLEFKIIIKKSKILLTCSGCGRNTVITSESVWAREGMY